MWGERLPFKANLHRLALGGGEIETVLLAQASRSCTSESMLEWWLAGRTSARLRSSTYLKLWVMEFSEASLMRLMKMMGPNLVPWGTPQERTSHSERAERFWTRWRRDAKRSAIQGMISLLTLRSQRFWIARVWSTQSKALEKSVSTNVPTVLGLSIPL